MKKPRDWETYSSFVLNAFITELSHWNASQPISDAAHNKHYRDEIAPLVERRDALAFAWINKARKTPITTTHEKDKLAESIRRN